MYIWFDTKNNVECVTDIFLECKYCTYKTRKTLPGECPKKDCIYYSEHIKGQRLYHKGNIGSLFVGLLNFNLDILLSDLLAIDSSYVLKNIKKINMQEWISFFKTTKLSLGKFWEVFYIIPVLYDLFGDYYSDITETGVVNPDLEYRYETMRHVLRSFKFYKEYTLLYIEDEKNYNAEMFEFMDRLYNYSRKAQVNYAGENVDYTLNGMMLNIFDLKYNIIQPTPENPIFFDHLVSAKERIKYAHEQYIKSKKNQTNEFGNFDKAYECTAIYELIKVSLFEALNAEYKFKLCQNCELPFIPYNRSDTMYCDRPSPQDYTKTCKEYGGRQTYQENLKNDKSVHLYRNTYMKLQMLVKRNPDIKEYQEKFDEFKITSKQWKIDVKEGRKTKEEYIKWLKSIKGREDLD